jgi:2-keto-4-pentenoate hydratase/2-oxohepta-3-ene-1,7-dioic acid hydratase in catechol pathway
LVAALHKGGRNIPVADALDLVFGYTLGLDMTRRDLQRALGNAKKPWEIGKSFDHSAPLGAIHRVAEVGHFTQGAIWLKVNGQLKQIEFDHSHPIYSLELEFFLFRLFQCHGRI